MDKIAIVTGIYDAYDVLKPTLEQKGVDVDWVLVTDTAHTDLLGWRSVMQPRPGVHPNVAAKLPKMKPWRYTDSQWSIWLDASFRIVSNTFAKDMLALLEREKSSIMQFGHPSRDCIYSEAGISNELPKYRGLPIDEQMAFYREHGHPERWGLWATGLIVRDHDDSRVLELGDKWLHECETRSFQDQLSQAFVLRNCNLRPTNLPGSHWDNPWVRYEASHRHHTG